MACESRLKPGRAPAQRRASCLALLQANPAYGTVRGSEAVRIGRGPPRDFPESVGEFQPGAGNDGRQEATRTSLLTTSATGTTFTRTDNAAAGAGRGWPILYGISVLTLWSRKPAVGSRPIAAIRERRFSQSVHVA